MQNMGFFSSIGGAISSGFKAAGRVVGGAIEKTGQFIGSEGLENAGRYIKDACSKTASDVGESSSYDRDKASVAQTVNINEILTQFSHRLKDQADELEQNALEDIRSYFEDIIDQIETSDVDIPTKQIRRAMTQTEREVKGTLKSYLAKRVSIDDHECLRILELPPGNDKINKMETFGRKVIKSGLDDLSVKIETVVKKYNDDLSETLNQVVELREKELKQVQSQFDEMLEQANGDIIDKEAAKLKPLILIQGARLVEENIV